MIEWEFWVEVFIVVEKWRFEYCFEFGVDLSCIFFSVKEVYYKVLRLVGVEFFFDFDVVEFDGVF